MTNGRRRRGRGGGTGRHTGLKILWGFPPYGFDPRPRHSLLAIGVRRQDTAWYSMLDEQSYGVGLVERLIAALRLDLRLYETVSGDAAATGQAFRIVLFAGVSNGLGLVRRLGGIGVLAGIGSALLGWLLWTGVIWLIAILFGHYRQDRSLLRAVGFANAPGVFLILGIAPMVGGVIRLCVVAWLVATTVRAVQATFAVATRRALVISALGFVVYLVMGLASSYFAS